MRRTLAGLILSAAAMFAQTGFEVVSIKPSDPLSNNMHMGVGPGGGFEASGVTLRLLIQQAYDVRNFQILGGQGWVDSDKYDIVTKDEAKGPSEAELGKMTDAQRDGFRLRLLGKLQLLLADRFQLKAHRETKELPVYELTVAKGGSRLQSAADDGGGSNLSSWRTDDGKSQITAKHFPIANLARFLSGQVGRTVIDKTGLTAKYDFQLTYAPDMGDITGPSLFTALQEQLGLKLDSQKGPVEVVVIDSVEKASGN
jgi:bla regulator protein blaR1